MLRFQTAILPALASYFKPSPPAAGTNRSTSCVASFTVSLSPAVSSSREVHLTSHDKNQKIKCLNGVKSTLSPPPKKRLCYYGF